MERTALAGAELAYEARGAGEPIVFLHAAVFADWFAPLLAEPALTERFRLVSYHRIGYAGSSRPEGPVSIADQARHCLALLRHLGLEQAHLVGHSSGGNIALQLALDAPEAVKSLALLEPAVLVAPSEARLGQEVVGPAFQRYATGDKAGAIDTFLRGAVDPDYRAAVEQGLPRDALAQAAADADTVFGVELPSVLEWRFSREQAALVRQPALLVTGARSHPVYGERHQLLLEWLPQATGFVLPEATHLLHVLKPRELAAALAAFFGRRPSD